MNSFTKLLFMMLLFQIGCMNESGDYSGCVDVETARCELRKRCDSGFDIDQCIYYYKEQCRIREFDNDATDKQLSACIKDLESIGSDKQCKELDKLKSDENEICKFSELVSCRRFLCTNPDDHKIEDTDTNTDSDTFSDTDSDTDTNTDSDTFSDTDSDTDTTIPDGLNPAK